MQGFKGGDKLIPINKTLNSGCGSLGDAFRSGRVAYIVAQETNSDKTVITSWSAYNKEGERVMSTCCTLNVGGFKLYSNESALNNIMAKVTNLAKRLLDADTKAFIEAGVLNKDLTLTDEGRLFLEEDYLEQNKKRLATKAKALVDETKEEAKN